MNIDSCDDIYIFVYAEYAKYIICVTILLAPNTL